MTRGKVFLVKGVQAVTLPDGVAFSPALGEVDVVREGNRVVVTPADAGWDGFFVTPDTDLGERDEGEHPPREPF